MPTILVVDDDREWRRFLDKYLATLGLFNYSVENGVQALEFTKTVQPKLILLDWCLKGMSGEQVLLFLKANPSTKHVPIIVMSGLKTTAEDEARARRAGAVQFVTKNEISDTVKDRKVFQRRLQALILGQEPPDPRPRGVAWSAPLSGPSGRVLVVDDDPDFCELMSMLLTREGYSVACANDGGTALSAAQRDVPDLVLLDLALPDMDGIGVCSQLKKSPRTRPVPVIILSARSAADMEHVAIEHGADRYFSKPLQDSGNFHRRIEPYLRRRLHQGDQKAVRLGDLVVDFEAHTASIDGKVVEKLTGIPFRLLCEFVLQPGRILSKDYLGRRIWHHPVADNNVELAVSRLKQLLGDAFRDRLVSVHGAGYCFYPFSSFGSGPAE